MIKFVFEPLCTHQGSPAHAISRPSFHVHRVSQVGILLVLLSAVAHGQQGLEKDARVELADALIAKGGAENLLAGFRLYEQAALAGNADAMSDDRDVLLQGDRGRQGPEKSR